MMGLGKQALFLENRKTSFCQLGIVCLVIYTTWGKKNVFSRFAKDIFIAKLYKLCQIDLT